MRITVDEEPLTAEAGQTIAGALLAAGRRSWRRAPSGAPRGVFFGIVTLSVTLVFERFMAQTAGPEWRIGAARLNGYNGMSGMPPLTLPWFGGNIVLFPDIGLYYLVLALLVLTYLGLRILVNSRFGNVLVAIRENPERAEMLGYDVRKYQLGGFVIGLVGMRLAKGLSITTGYVLWGFAVIAFALSGSFSRNTYASGTMYAGSRSSKCCL